MRSLRFALLATVLAASTAFASPTDPKNGVEYVTLAQPQPVQATGKKVEVIEFFMYHCPHCNALEPQLEQWVKKQGDNIVFKRVHLPSSGPNDPEAHLRLTLEEETPRGLQPLEQLRGGGAQQLIARSRCEARDVMVRAPSRSAARSLPPFSSHFFPENP